MSIGLIPALHEAVDRRVDDAPVVAAGRSGSAGWKPGGGVADPGYGATRAQETWMRAMSTPERLPVGDRVVGRGAAAEQDRVVGDAGQHHARARGRRPRRARTRAARRVVRCTGSQPMKLGRRRGVALSRSASSRRVAGLTLRATERQKIRSRSSSRSGTASSSTSRLKCSESAWASNAASSAYSSYRRKRTGSSVVLVRL